MRSTDSSHYGRGRESIARWYRSILWCQEVRRSCFRFGWRVVARASQPQDRAHRVGNTGRWWLVVRVLRFGVDLMALANSQGLDDTRSYRRLVAHACNSARMDGMRM